MEAHRTLWRCLGDMTRVVHRRDPQSPGTSLEHSLSHHYIHSTILSWLCWIPRAWWGGVLPTLPTPRESSGGQLVRVGQGDRVRLQV